MAKDHRGQPSQRQKGAEWHIPAFAEMAGQLHADTDDGADDRGHQDHRDQCCPAKPGAQCSKKLEVAIAHAFLAGQQLEGLIDGPQRHIAGDGTPKSMNQRYLGPPQRRGNQACPQKR
jgi:hypothetical protein